MTIRKRLTATEHRVRDRSCERLYSLITSVLALTAIVVPLWVVSDAFDVYRLPKRIAVETATILLLTLGFAGVVFEPRRFLAPLRQFRKELLLVSAIVIWTGITSVTSSNRPLSRESFVWVVCCAILVTATLLVGRRSGGVLLIASLAPAAANGAIAILQRTGTYSPLPVSQEIAARLQVTGLIGNANTLATSLLFSTIVALALALVSRGRRRAAAVCVTLLCAGGILASETVSAIVTLAVACAALFAIRLRRPVVVATTALVLLGAITWLTPALRARAGQIGEALREGRINEALSSRVPANLVALAMIHERPLLGVGPGTFHWWYLPHKLELNQRKPALASVTMNFGEAHNDHLQTMAVAGIPAYGLFLAAALLVGSCGVRRHDAPEDFGTLAEWARVAAIPVAVGFLVVTLAQFPLEHPISATLFHYAALIVAWRPG